MATIERRTSHGQTVYYVKIRRKGFPPRSATFPKLSDARRWAQSNEAALTECRYLPQEPLKQHTVSDLLERYRNDVLPQKRPSTVYGQAYQLPWWEAQLGHYLLSDLTPTLIITYRDKLAKTRGNATVRRYLAVLSHAFTCAVEWQWMNENPCYKVRKPKEPRGRVRFLSDEERVNLLEACKTSRNPHLYTIVILALSTGARRGELLGLRWSDVDLKRGTMTFHETKNGERRSVPLTGQALSLLQHGGKGLVFPDATGTKPLSIRDAFANAVERAGIEDFRFHDLRHSAASYLAMGGASLLEISEILGHKSLDMVKRYSHLSAGHTRSVVERMNQNIFGDR